METFSERKHPLTIRDVGKIYSARGDGKVPFICAEDITTMAFHTLIDEKLQSTNHRVLDPNYERTTRLQQS
ncbi:hypothetical protein BJ138DRAFT_1145767 [Hygrophoropsis aurantiaca]|uniref:Uncharacterized protein n=1 Tax=Hygrophoropsis aurantiaca TaxID=72124 RepID=A0ACB8AJN3_9AGAM|nr:hypothetical protein BJ138DRAFT_1145767 [Hygrophoropsis aurantiaca]